MALLIPADGSVPRNVAPTRGPAFTLEELQRIVGGHIEAVYLRHREPDGQLLVMFVNEDGKQLRLPSNYWATMFAEPDLRPDDVIVGDVVVCTFVEAGVHEDEA